jgi:hypothetical protein
MREMTREYVLFVSKRGTVAAFRATQSDLGHT